MSETTSRYSNIYLNDDSYKKEDKAVISLLYPYLLENLEQDQSLLKFLDSHKHAKNWMIFSDYCLDQKTLKKNLSVTFSILPYNSPAEYQFYEKWLGTLHSKDIKKSKINEKFIRFTKTFPQLPIFNFSVILEKGFNFYKDKDVSLEKYFDLRLDSLSRSFLRNTQYGLAELPYQESINNVKRAIQALKQKGKVSEFKKVELITTITTSLIKMIGDSTPDKKNIAWCSDRDVVMNILKGKTSSPIIFDMIYHDIHAIATNTHNQLSFIFNQDKNNDNLVRVADFIAGTLSDFDLELQGGVSHEKFLWVLYYCLTNKEKNSILKLTFDDEIGPQLDRVEINTKPSSKFRWEKYLEQYGCTK